MRSSSLSLSPAALTRILDAAESSFPVTRRALSEATGLGLSTVARAEALCLSRGIWRYADGTDPVSGRACRTLLPTGKLLIPLLTVTRERGVVRVVDTAMEVIASAVTELHPAAPPEESARLLCRRGMTLLRGCSAAGRITAPILLADGPAAAVLNEAAQDVMGASPLAVMSQAEAVSHAARAGALPTAGESLLFVSVGGVPHACLLLLDGAGRWRPTSLGDGLTATLTRALRGSDPSAEGIRRAVAVFLAELCRFLRPDAICLEDPRGILPDGSAYEPLLPEGVAVAVKRGEGLTAAESGGALAGRRMLWEKILLG